MATQKEKLNKMCPAANAVTDGLGTYLETMRTCVNALVTATNAVITNQAEIITKIEATDDLLNGETNLSETYDLAVTEDAPDAVTDLPPATLEA